MPGRNVRPLPPSRLDHVLDHAKDVWADLRGARLFVTGGSGFFGRWMVESFLRANEEFELGAEAVILTRDAQAFADRAPHVARHQAVTLIEGDVRSFDFPLQECS